jgi:hypothetical protein
VKAVLEAGARELREMEYHGQVKGVVQYATNDLERRLIWVKMNLTTRRQFIGHPFQSRPLNLIIIFFCGHIHFWSLISPPHWSSFSYLDAARGKSVPMRDCNVALQFPIQMGRQYEERKLDIERETKVLSLDLKGKWR